MARENEIANVNMSSVLCPFWQVEIRDIVFKDEGVAFHAKESQSFAAHLRPKSRQIDFESDPTAPLLALKSVSAKAIRNDFRKRAAVRRLAREVRPLMRLRHFHPPGQKPMRFRGHSRIENCPHAKLLG